MNDNIYKFSDKVENYAKYRPDYPVEILKFLEEYDFDNNSIIADIGSGTGKLTKIFLENNNIVYAVEPNDNMRNMADQSFSEFKKYFSINGSAENTTLQNEIIDFVVVGQAFHWFDTQKALYEFKRILKKNGVLVLAWNYRKTNTLFLKEYENLLKTFSGYNESAHRNISDEKIEKHFVKDYKKYILGNVQEFTFTELLGRFLSTSYTPKEKTNEYIDSYKSLEILYSKYNINDKVVFNYDTTVFIGRI